ncbi:MAG: permease prefix domain 1-containing protein [Spirochaetaceae bacterium]|jgi:hypothetical protein|nr:permease prefix domain 1-containing protein [Spirochaetaceae bacterium]
MDSKSYVDSLFADYEQSDVLIDFKAELVSNLEARIAAMVRKGMSEEEAFNAAAKELADVQIIADELSLKKRQEVFAECYLDSSRFISPRRAVFYAVCGVVLLFSIITAIMTYFTTQTLTAALGVLFAFAPISLAGFTFLGLTQESAASFPMKKRRAAVYTIAVFLFFCALALAPLTWAAMAESSAPVFGGKSLGQIPQDTSVTAALGIIIAFALPAVAFFIYLGLTEKPRLKPWVINAYHQHDQCVPGTNLWAFADTKDAARFGVITGAVWMFALVIFALLWYFISVKIAWTAFPAAIGCTLLVQGGMAGKKHQSITEEKN